MTTVHLHDVIIIKITVNWARNYGNVRNRPCTGCFDCAVPRRKEAALLRLWGRACAEQQRSLMMASSAATRSGAAAVKVVKPIFSRDLSEARRRARELYRAWYREVPNTGKLQQTHTQREREKTESRSHTHTHTLSSL